MDVVVEGATAVAAVIEVEAVDAIGLGAKGLVRFEVKDSEGGGYDDDEDVCDWDNDCDRCPEWDAPEEAAGLLGSPYMSRNACSGSPTGPYGRRRQWATIALIESEGKWMKCGERDCGA